MTWKLDVNMNNEDYVKLTQVAHWLEYATAGELLTETVQNLVSMVGVEDGSGNVVTYQTRYNGMV